MPAKFLTKSALRKVSLLGLASAIALTSGCAGNPDTNGISRGNSNRHLSDVEARASDGSAQLMGLQATGRPANITVRDGVYLGQDGFRTNRGDPLPARFETKQGIVLNLAGEVDLPVLARAIEEVTKIRVDYTDLLHADNLGASGGAAGSADSTGQATPAAALQLAGDFSPLDHEFRVNFSGKLSELLDQTASKLTVDWRYRGGRIEFLGPETKAYTLWALPSSNELTNTFGQAGSSFGGQSPSAINTTFKSDYWASIDSTLRTILPSSGASYSINQAVGTVVVTGTQATHQRVADYVSKENARMSRQVAIKVDVIAFTANKGDERSANLGLVLDRAAAGLNMTLTSPDNPIAGGVGLGATVLSDTTGRLDDLSSSKGIINSLAQQGRVAILSSTSVVALNNSPTPVSINREKAYLAGSRTETGDTGTTTTLETGVVNSGMSMVVTPRILSSGEMLVNYTLNMSELREIERFGTDDGTSVVQLPEVDTRNFMQTVSIDSGDALVIASYDSKSTNRTSMGPFNAKWWGLGGRDKFSTENTKILVMMTPVVIEQQNKPSARP